MVLTVLTVYTYAAPPIWSNDIVEQQFQQSQMEYRQQELARFIHEGDEQGVFKGFY
jgi:hypothetical protein